MRVSVAITLTLLFQAAQCCTKPGERVDAIEFLPCVRATVAHLVLGMLSSSHPPSFLLPRLTAAATLLERSSLLFVFSPFLRFCCLVCPLARNGAGSDWLRCRRVRVPTRDSLRRQQAGICCRSGPTAAFATGLLQASC